MRNLLALTTFIALMAIAAPAQAQLSYHGIETSIGNDLSATINVTLKFSEPASSIEYRTTLQVSSLKTGGDFGPVACNYANGDSGGVITCSLSGITADKNTLYLNIISNGAVNYSYGRYHYNAGFDTSSGTEQFFSLIKLPASATLADNLPAASYDPAESTTITDGQRIMVIWDSSNITTGQQLDFRVEYNLPPILGSVTRYIVIGAGAIILAVVGVAFLYIRRSSKFNKSSAIASVLNADEKRVVDIITAGGSGALQKHIVRESGFSKAKVSRLVKSLGGRGVVKVEPVSGRENRILLVSGKEKKEEKKEQDNGGGNENEGKDGISQA